MSYAAKQTQPKQRAAARDRIADDRDGLRGPAASGPDGPVRVRAARRSEPNLRRSRISDFLVHKILSLNVLGTQDPVLKYIWHVKLMALQESQDSYILTQQSLTRITPSRVLSMLKHTSIRRTECGGSRITSVS
jgi:hypothetical protein